MFQIWLGIGEVIEVGEPKTVGEAGNQVLQFKFLTYDTYNDVRTDTIHQITVWGKNVTSFITNHKAGDVLEVRGLVKTQSWIDNKTAERRYRTYVQATGLKKVDLGGLKMLLFKTDGEEQMLPFN